jgi:hypothetical protein
MSEEVCPLRTGVCKASELIVLGGIRSWICACRDYSTPRIKNIQISSASVLWTVFAHAWSINTTVCTGPQKIGLFFFQATVTSTAYGTVPEDIIPCINNLFSIKTPNVNMMVGNCTNTPMFVGFEVFTAVTMKNAVFWGVAIRSSETSVQSTTTTRRHTPEDDILHTDVCFTGR